MGYVFISYSSKHQLIADSVRKKILESNIDCWMAPYDIPTGSKYAAIIDKAIQDCSCFLLIFSLAAQDSVYVGKEVERAISYKKPVLPMKIEEFELNAEFKFYLGNQQITPVLDIDENIDEFNKIISAIKVYNDIDDNAIERTSKDAKPKTKLKIHLQALHYAYLKFAALTNDSSPELAHSVGFKEIRHTAELEDYDLPALKCTVTNLSNKRLIVQEPFINGKIRINENTYDGIGFMRLPQHKKTLDLGESVDFYLHGPIIVSIIESFINNLVQSIIVKDNFDCEYQIPIEDIREARAYFMSYCSDLTALKEKHIKYTL